MDDKFVDKLLDELIHEAVKQPTKEEPDTIKDEEITFSEEHEQKMQELFASVRKKERLTQAFSVTTKVAAVIVVATALIVFTPTAINAWKEKIKEFFIKEEAEYSWIKFGDPSEADGFNVVHSGEDNGLNDMLSVSSGDLKVDFLGYVPEGFEVSEVVKDKPFSRLIALKKYENVLTIRITKESSKAMDTENQELIKIKIGNKKMYQTQKNNDTIIILENNGYVFKVLGTAEYKEIIKVIENINYEKVENIF